MDGTNKEVTLTFLNVLLVAGNIYWQWRFRKVGTDTQVLQTLIEQGKAKDLIIENLKTEAAQREELLKQLLSDYKKLQEEVQKSRSQSKEEFI